ncbi:MAG: aminotransferase class I/II-fold pyridoxal phosphate-dependent enzyme [Candidatus Eisenbacteria bacterium]|nr:aminotransferase class I/II-fold pyridoxal phosphate-dependent enzyme [Candidatus Eisenbacteria bacterium]
MLEPSTRLKNLAPYALAKLDLATIRKKKEGVDVIDLGVGNPDQRPAKHIVDSLHRALDDPKIQNHRYPSFAGLPEFREAIAGWYKERFNVKLDPATEVLPLVGSKEGISKFFLAHISKGDGLLLSTPCYPAYLGAAQIAEADTYEVPIVEKNSFLIDLEALPKDVVKKAKLLTINYPHNPTGGIETDEFYKDLLAWTDKNNVFILSDIAYCDLSLDDSYRARSFLEFDTEKKHSVEFHSFSKSFNMPGWRLGFVVGNGEAVQNLLKIKANMDFGVFMAIQRVGIETLKAPKDCIKETALMYRRRRDVFVSEASRLGWDIRRPKATMYLWMKIPRKYETSEAFANDLIEKTGVVVGPGSGFGIHGEGYVRIALIETEERLKEVINRMEKAGFRY